MTKETTRMIGNEIANQVTRKLNDNRSRLNLQIQEAINTAVTERVLPSIENSLVAHGRASSTMEDQRASGLQDSPRAPNFTMAVQRSSGLQRNSEVTNPQKTKENRLKMVFSRANQREMSRDSSVDSYTSEQYRDMVTGANLTHTWFRVSHCTAHAIPLTPATSKFRQRRVSGYCSPCPCGYNPHYLSRPH